MSPRRKWRFPCCALAVVACALFAPGCASWQCPRIDPSGQQLLIWPGQTPPPVAPPPPGAAQPQVVIPAPGSTATTPPPITTPPPVITTPPPPPPTVGLPTGNLQAPPAYPDAGVPSTPPPVITVPPPPPSGTPPVTTIPTAAAPVPPPPPAVPAVDAQFAFPAPTIAQAGHPLVLTTLVTRRTDRVPLAGWTVRYEVTNNGAALGSGGNRVEVPTDASGRASIEISPMSTAPGEAIVNMVAIAPPELTTGPSPTAEVARGTATITWRQGVPGAPAWAPQPLVFSGAMPAPSLTGPPLAAPSGSDSISSTSPYSNERTPGRFEPPPPLADRETPPKTYAPPPREQVPVGKPELSVEVRRRSPAQVDVGGFASFDVIVTNRGNATARNIKVLDRFDAGLTHIRAQAGERAVKYESMHDLAPGDSETVPLTFGVLAAGELCHEVTITADNAATVDGRGCITAVAAKPAGQPTIEVTKQGPRRHYVGELALFSIVIKNTGDVPVTNLVVNDRYDAALDPRSTGAGATRLEDDSFEWRIPRLEKGERREIKVSAACVSPSTKACSTATVTADGGIMITEERCVEILPSLPQLPAGPGGVTPAPALPAVNLKVTLQSTANPARVGTPASLYVFVENVGQKTEQAVALRVQMPPETPPIAAQIKPAGSSKLVGALEVQFNDIGELAPGERQEFEIPFTPTTARVVTFNAQIASASMTQPVNTESNPIQIEAAAQ